MARRVNTSRVLRGECRAVEAAGSAVRTGVSVGDDDVGGDNGTHHATCYAYTTTDAHEEDTEEDLGVGAQPPKPKPTWVQEIFGGVLTNEVRCINCECVTSRQEQILDLSLDIEQVGAPFARSHRPQRQPHAHEMLR